MAKAKSPAEKRADLQKQMDELDLSRVQGVKEIFEREAVQQAMADLKALSDPADGTALHRAAQADASALIANLLLPLEVAVAQAEQMIERLDRAVNPPTAATAPEAAQPPADGPATASVKA